MKWKPEVLHLGYHGTTLRWMNDWRTITLSWNSLFVSLIGYGYVGIRLDWKEFLIGIHYYADSTGHSLQIHPFPCVEIPIHWRKKANRCATKVTSSQSTSPLSVI